MGKQGGGGMGEWGGRNKGMGWEGCGNGVGKLGWGNRVGGGVGMDGGRVREIGKGLEGRFAS